jgi:uncharacterized protein YbjQ (UPF0145 family)
MKKILHNIVVTTTPSLEGWSIEKYLTVVTSHVVTGTGLLSDFAAGLSDIFGGKSESYRKQIEAIDDEAIEALRVKAHGVGATAIVGLVVSHAEISGKDKQMFMCTARGTAVAAKPTESSSRDDQSAKKRIEVSQLELAAERKNLLAQVEGSETGWLSDANWKFIVRSKAEEFIPHVLNCLARKRSDAAALGAEFPKQAEGFLSLFPREQICDEVCNWAATADDPAALIEIVRRLNLLSIDASIKLLTSDDLGQAKVGARLLFAHKASYSVDDISLMSQASELIERRFPRLAPIVEERGVFGTKNRWRCPSCQSACEPTTDTCTSCGSDCYGFTRDEGHRDVILRDLAARRSLLADVLG